MSRGRPGVPKPISAEHPRCNRPTRLGAPCQRVAVNGGPCSYHDQRQPHPADSWRKWPLSRRWKLMELMERGWDDERIARALGTTAAAVHLACKRYRIASRRHCVLTASAVARRLGVGCAKTVAWWIDEGWLRGHRGWRQGLNRTYVVRESSVLAFLEDPAHWHRYDVEHIADEDWKRWALTCRGDVRVLRVGEAAWIACVEIATIGQWIRKGWIPAKKRGPNWFVRSDDLAVVIERREQTGSPAIEPALVALQPRPGTVVDQGEVAA